MKYKFLPAILSLFNFRQSYNNPFINSSGKQWNGAGFTDRWSDPNNWYPVGVPAINDKVVFGNLGNKNCWIDVDTEHLESFNVLSSYSGNIDCSLATITANQGFGYSGDGKLTGGVADFNIGGPVILSGANVALGSSRWTLTNYPFIINSRIISTDESLLVVPVGITTSLYTPEVANVNVYGFLNPQQNLVVYGDVNVIGDLVSDYAIDFQGEGSNLRIGKTGQCYGDGTLNLRDKAGIPANSGYLSFGHINIFDEHGAVGGIASGSFYGSRINFINTDGPDTLYFRGGRYVFNSPVTFSNSGVAPYRIDNSQFNPQLEFGSNIDFTTVDGGSFEWIRGTGIVKLFGTSSGDVHTINFSGGPIESLEILASGTKALKNHIQTRNLYFDAGRLHISGKNITTQGIFYSAPTANFVSGGLTGSTITVSGDLSLTGSGLKLDAPGNWSLNVTGNTFVANARVANSNASAGSLIHAYNSVNIGNNTNWSFSIDSGTNALHLTAWNSVRFLETNPFTLADSGGQNPRPLNLYMHGLEGISSGVFYFSMTDAGTGSGNNLLYLTVNGGSLSGLSNTLPISIFNSGVYSNLFLYVRGDGIADDTITASGSTWLMIRNDGVDASLPMYVVGGDAGSGVLYMNMFGVLESSGVMYMYVKGLDVPEKRIPLFIRGF
jgi:hypothetical protein